MKLNTAPRFAEKTHEGATAARMTPEQALRRSVMSCLLWEQEAYEDGQTIAERIAELCAQVAPEVVAATALEARRMGLRHVPLLLLCELTKHSWRGTAEVIYNAISRADEMTELLAVYWRNGRRPVPAAMKRGLADAFEKFDEHRLAKYDRPGAVKLRDVLRVCHPTPANEERSALYRRVSTGQLATPDTWEVALSSGADKRETWERLLREGKLGYLALLRNLRGMTAAGVDRGLIQTALLDMRGAGQVFPFRFIAAARACPELEPTIDQALLSTLANQPRLGGLTCVLVDVSGSMNAKLSAKSDLTRMDAACALASIIHGDVRVFSFSGGVVEVPARRGMAGVEAVKGSQQHGGTDLGGAVRCINGCFPCDRLIVITDEQTSTRVPAPFAKRAYMINVASEKNGIGYGNNWVHIDGFSESVLRFIGEHEAIE